MVRAPECKGVRWGTGSRNSGFNAEDLRCISDVLRNSCTAPFDHGAFVSNAVTFPRLAART